MVTGGAKFGRGNVLALILSITLVTTATDSLCGYKITAQLSWRDVGMLILEIFFSSREFKFPGTRSMSRSVSQLCPHRFQEKLR